MQTDNSNNEARIALSLLNVGLGVIDPSWDKDTNDMTEAELRDAVGILRTEIVRRGFVESQLRESPSIEAAYAMGVKGGPVVEAERLAFEAWMRGHCWAVTAVWDGTTYRGSAEHGNYICPHAMQIRQLWAAWRDRAALAPNV